MNEAGQQFEELRDWLAYQLLDDPYQKVEPLIKIFMAGFYGEASPHVHKYLDYVHARADRDAQFQYLRFQPHNLKYLDLEFFVKSQALFDAAEKSVNRKSFYYRHVSNERFVLDGALLYLWPWLEKKLPGNEKMLFSRSELIDRYEREWKLFVEDNYSRFYSYDKNSLNKDGKLLSRMLALFRDPKIPEEFKNKSSKDIADFNWLTFSNIRPRLKLVPDKDAVGGMAAIFSGKKPYEGDDLIIGAGDSSRKIIKNNDIKRDGSFHLYKLGKVEIKPGVVIWALSDKTLGVNIDRLYVKNSRDKSTNMWNAYISLKVKKVKGIDNIWFDRVLLVKPEKN
ncbi:MAG: DUF4838 domain-containing protein [Planctomycetota bacterium]|jgi:hypothetical protein